MIGRSALVIDKHELFRDAIARLLSREFGFHEIRTATNSTEARAYLADGYTPDLVTIDTPETNPSRSTDFDAILRDLPSARLAIVAESDRRDHVLEALAAGAHGFIPKNLPAAEIVDAFAVVLAGRVYVPAALNRRPSQPIPAAPSAKADVLGLTPRQRKVVDALLTGASNRNIAAQLGLAENTVKIHLAAIFRTLGVHSRSEAIVLLK